MHDTYLEFVLLVQYFNLNFLDNENLKIALIIIYHDLLHFRANRKLMTRINKSNHFNTIILARDGTVAINLLDLRVGLSTFFRSQELSASVSMTEYSTREVITIINFLQKLGSDQHSTSEETDPNSDKLCYDGHEERENVPCQMDVVSCGRTCGKQLQCGQHQCTRVSHDGDCTDKCNQPCQVPRSSCGHICGAACHTGTCPDVACSAHVSVTCECGQRTTTVSCSDQTFSKMSTSLLDSVDLSELAKRTRKLDCNEECFKIARNAKFAEAQSFENNHTSDR